jgi:hypothetical protein
MMGRYKDCERGGNWDLLALVVYRGRPYAFPLAGELKLKPERALDVQLSHPVTNVLAQGCPEFCCILHVGSRHRRGIYLEHLARNQFVLTLE